MKELQINSVIWKHTEVITTQHLIKKSEPFLPLQTHCDALTVPVVFNYTTATV